MDPVDALIRLGGVASLGELVGPTTRSRVRTAVARGRILRVAHDRYGLVDLPSERRVAVAAGGVLSHLSAAVAWGWKVKHLPLETHVTVPARARRPTGKVAVHWADLDEAEVQRDVTRPARTVVDCARTLPFDEALAVADSALRSGMVDRHELERAAARAPRNGRSRAAEVVDLARGQAANPFESVLRALALDVPGLRVVPQGEVEGVGFADLLDRRLKVVAEAESFEFHSGKEALRRDVQRYTAMTRRGFTVVRFLWEEVMFQPAYVREVLGDVTALSEARLRSGGKRRRSA